MTVKIFDDIWYLVQVNNKAHGPELTHSSEIHCSHCRYADVMQHFFNPGIATNDIPLITHLRYNKELAKLSSLLKK